MEASADDSAQRASLVVAEAVQAAILDAALDPIILMDARGRVRDFNPAAERVFGYARAAVLGRDMAALIVPEHLREAHRRGLARLVATGVSTVLGRRIELTALRATGEEFPIELAISAVPGHEGSLFAGYVRDLSEQRRAEARQRFLLEASREIASTLDFEDTLRRVARLLVPTLCDGCGVYLSEDGRTARRVAVANVDPTKEAIARRLHERHLLSSDEPYGVARVLRTGRAELMPEMTDELIAAVAVDAEQLEVLRALGVRSSMIVPLRVRDRVVGALSLVTDASGRVFGPADLAIAEEFALRTAAAVDNSLLYREAQEAVARAAEEARRREALIGALERSNADLDGFAYVASHDLKAPLRGIASLAEWIEEDLGAQIPDGVRGHLGMLRGRVARLEGLIEGILAYSRAGRTGRAVVEVDVGALLAETVELLAPPPTATVTIEPGMPVLRTARAPLQQVFMNLIGNALKHAAGPATAVRVSAREADGFWEFSVTDNGPGIAPAFHERIWGMFQTLKPRDEVEGTGIGLSVVRKTVTAMGGRAWVESADGVGSCFRFTWPAVPPAEP
ncbi:MAG: ATP-binding protein [Deltaproteobacteria bacterium]|nr:ATP-binding protein [Myxococcales bacterium]MDP3213417.1 ATP-binding protein [Deltaproteobacteria bacterium]